METLNPSIKAADELQIAGDLRNSYVRGPSSPEHEIAKTRAYLHGWSDARIWAALQPVLHEARVATLGKLRSEVERTGTMLVGHLTRQALAAGCSKQEIQAEVHAALHARHQCMDARTEERPLELVPYDQH